MKSEKEIKHLLELVNQAINEMVTTGNYSYLLPIRVAEKLTLENVLE